MTAAPVSLTLAGRTRLAELADLASLPDSGPVEINPSEILAIAAYVEAVLGETPDGRPLRIASETRAMIREMAGAYREAMAAR